MTLKKLDFIAIIISIAVLFLVVLMRYVKIDNQFDLSYLPPFHAILNTITSFLLIFAFIKIKSKNVNAHRKAIYGAIVCSVIFLLSYVVYHFLTPASKIWWRRINKSNLLIFTNYPYNISSSVFSVNFVYF